MPPVAPAVCCAGLVSGPVSEVWAPSASAPTAIGSSSAPPAVCVRHGLPPGLARIGSIGGAVSTWPRRALASQVKFCAEAVAGASRAPRRNAARASRRSGDCTGKVMTERGSHLRWLLRRDGRLSERHRSAQDDAAPADTQAVEQVSLPMRIALLAVLAFASLWFVALRPKPVSDAPPTPAPATANPVTDAPGKAEAAVGKANGATAGRDAAAADVGADATSAAGAKSAPTASKPAATPAAGADKAKPAEAKQNPGLKRVLGDLDKKRTVVLLFWDGKTSVDREVRRAVAATDRHEGRVKVHVQRISKLGPSSRSPAASRSSPARPSSSSGATARPARSPA
jgi:hypothetical protein